MTTRKLWVNLARLGVTGLCLWFALAQFDLAEIGTLLAGVRLPAVVAILLLMGAGLAIRAVRWWLLLRGLGADVSLGYLVLLYLAGNFFNTFLPSGFGGDVVRVVEAGRQMPAARAAGSVLLDRLSGLVVLFVIALIALPFRPPEMPSGQVALVAGVAGGGLLMGGLLLNPRAIRRLLMWLPETWGAGNGNPLARFLAAVAGAGRPALAGALTVSLVFNLMLFAWWWLAGLALGYDLAFGHVVLAVPLLSLSLLVPSVGGLGVREVVAQLLFAAAGLGPAEAAALSLLEFTLLRLTGLLGAPAYLWTAWRERRATGDRQVER